MRAHVGDVHLVEAGVDVLLQVRDVPPEIYISAFGPKALALAARIGDGWINNSPNADMVAEFKEKSGGKPTQGGAKAAWADTEEEGVDIAHRLWANAGLPG